MGVQKRYSECIDRWIVTYLGTVWFFETEKEADEKVAKCKKAFTELIKGVRR